MKRYSLRFFISLAAAFIVAGATAAASAVQSDEGHVVQVSALLSRDGVEAGGTIKAAILLKIDAAYHINDNAPLDEFMFPTSLGVDSEDFEVVETFFPAGKRGKYAYTEVELVVYEGEATLGLLLKAKDGLKPGTCVAQGIARVPGLRPYLLPAAQDAHLRHPGENRRGRRGDERDERRGFRRNQVPGRGQITGGGGPVG